MAHILADHQVDCAWNPAANNPVNDLVVSGGTVYVGGSFNTINGETRKNLAAIETATGNTTAWAPDANGDVQTLAVDGATVYAGGMFSTINGITRNLFAAIDAVTGAPTS